MRKIIKITIIVVVTLFVVWLYIVDFGKNKTVDFGVTFSQKYAAELNLDWQETLTALLDDLGVRKFRLVAYWDLIESDENVYDFTALDWQLAEIEKRKGKVIMTLGHRVPRWPECHWPNWIYQYNQEEREQHILDLLKETVIHYQRHQSITAWQIENEPFLRVFGRCPRPDKDFYEKEIDLVKSLDKRPVIVTESGELSTWLKGAVLGDQVGTSIYRITWSNIFGYFYYPLPPAHYYLKSKLAKLLTDVDNIFISEMQAEPWLPMPILLNPLPEQYRLMNLEKFKKNLSYVKKTGLSPVYFWGAEWWYWLKEQGDGNIWEEAKKIWQ